MQNGFMRIIAISAVNMSLVLFAGCEDTLTSPDGKVKVRVFVNGNDALTYNITRNRTKILEDSPIGITVDGIDLGSFVVLDEPKVHTANETYPWRGVHSVAVNHYNGATIWVTHIPTDTIYALEVRAFNDGAAFRYIVPGRGKRIVNSEKTAWNLPAGCEIWFQSNTEFYEDVYKKRRPQDVKAKPDEPVEIELINGSVKVKEANFLGLPVTIELADGTYATITEAALFNYSGLTLKATGTNMLVGVFQNDPDGWMMEGEIRSPWRVTMTGPSLNDLVNSDIVHNLCPAPDKNLFPEGMATDWIKPGTALWHWWSTEDVEFEDHKVWIDDDAKIGFDYYLIDEGWNHWKQGSRDKWDMMADLIDYANERGVGIWVWKACPDRSEIPGIIDKKVRQEFFKGCSRIGVAGVKIDFMESESKAMMDFYESALREAAKLKLMINFHGANKPAGEPRTYPNEMTREGVKGLEHNKWDTLPPNYYAALPFTRCLAGHADFTPCTFNPRFLKGTTFTQQLATAIVYTSPVIHWADKPEMYLRNKTIDIIRKIPSTWDQTIVLKGSKIGRLAAFARRKGDTWFVGIINGNKERPYNLNLSFLGQGDYSATIVRDVMNNPADMTLENITVRRKDKLSIDMRSGGGFVAYLSP
jgi:alpha-glucosidase